MQSIQQRRNACPRTLFSLTSALVALFLLVSCIVPPKPTTDKVVEQKKLSESLYCKLRRPLGKVDVENYWVKGQIIISGVEKDVNALIETLTGRGVRLEPLEECNFANAPLPEQENLDNPELQALYKEMLGEVRPLRQIGPLVKYLFALPNHSVEEVTKLANDIREERKKEQPFLAFADPNYILGPSSNSVCSNPNSVGSSPFEVAISPNSVGSSPFSGPGIITDTTEASQFASQWALQQIGMEASKFEGEGKGVTVAILDTSPYLTETPDEQQQTWLVLRNNVSFTLQVEYPVLGMTIATEAFTPTARADEHGLFVAGLVHAVAPQSQIRLIRALGANGCGDANTLISQFWQVLGTTPLAQPLVINLSLGIDGDPPTIAALGWALLNAGSRSDLIVAAAGNSNQTTAQIPASKPYVIGAAATTFDQKDACFSNFGDVGAPGGNGGDDGTGNLCAPISNLGCLVGDSVCHTRQQRNNLMSVVSIRNPGETGFAYWSGTSFATPLISGMVARMLGTMSATNIVNGLATPISSGGLTCPLTGTVKLGAGLAVLDGNCP